MGRVEMGDVSMWRRKRLSSALASRDRASRASVADIGTEDIGALRRAMGPGLIEVALFRR